MAVSRSSSRGARILAFVTRRLGELSEALALEPGCRRARWAAETYLRFLRSHDWPEPIHLDPIREVAEERCVRICLSHCQECALGQMLNADEWNPRGTERKRRR